MKRFHLTPDGEPKSCSASRKCPYGDLEEDHFESKDSARKAYEEKNASQAIPSSKTSFTWPKYSTTTVYPSSVTSGGELLVQVSDDLRQSITPHKVEAWLTLPEEGNVAFVSLLRHSEEYCPGVPEHVVLCDIEVRLDQRGKGRAREIIKSVEDSIGLPIYGSGSFTPEGWAALGAHIKYYPQVESGAYGEAPGVKFRSMGFVASWKGRVPRYPDSRIDYADEQRAAMYEASEARIFEKLQDKDILWVED